MVIDLTHLPVQKYAALAIDESGSSGSGSWTEVEGRNHFQAASACARAAWDDAGIRPLTVLTQLVGSDRIGCWSVRSSSGVMCMLPASPDWDYEANDYAAA